MLENYNYLYELVGRLVGLEKFNYESYKNLVKSYNETKDDKKKDKIRKFNHQLSELINKGNNPEFNRYLGKINAKLKKEDKVKDYESFFKLGEIFDNLKEKKEEVKEEKKDDNSKKQEVKQEEKIVKRVPVNKKNVKQPNKTVTKIFDGIETFSKTKFGLGINKVSNFFNNNKWGKKLGRLGRTVSIGLSVACVGLLALSGFAGVLIGANVLALAPGIIYAIPAVTGTYYLGKGAGKIIKKLYNKNRVEKINYLANQQEKQDSLFEIEDVKTNIKTKEKNDIFDIFDNQETKEPIVYTDSTDLDDEKEEEVENKTIDKEENKEEVSDTKKEETQKEKQEEKVENKIADNVENKEKVSDTKVQKTDDFRSKDLEYFENAILNDPIVTYNSDFMASYKEAKMAREMDYVVQAEMEEKTLSQKLDEYKTSLINYRKWEDALYTHPELKNNSKFLEAFKNIARECYDLGSDHEVSTFMNYLKNRYNDMAKGQDASMTKLGEIGIREQDVPNLANKMTDILLDAHSRIDANTKLGNTNYGIDVDDNKKTR